MKNKIIRCRKIKIKMNLFLIWKKMMKNNHLQIINIHFYTINNNRIKILFKKKYYYKIINFLKMI